VAGVSILAIIEEFLGMDLGRLPSGGMERLDLVILIIKDDGGKIFKTLEDPYIQ
jgi:2-succinyl-5-enolpyruvyl-6-hydroxy-3-cyclohexene-1-carboxylate synthase